MTWVDKEAANYVVYCVGDGYLCDCDFGFIGDFTVCWKTITDQLGDHGCGQIEILRSLSHLTLHV